ncbi:hypothetical protein K437DRAFT_59205 [Tilletiaria anomala UBC 951]|uniref:CENP-V/GFA domain-containing protein n=1 Tax=Tilletiaria anomala (strain ATCC 24038 / CBS 436.72 / UBC 951) TaxID=1037660 RepID=A0A066VC42_TILAU|nr:uncharacterized protein K437DRAFT_59205 [Tilletiaria anomala UBC 951]KDN36170.1 hypothetical protein K437DRAFT_59205 [Tilletiaria anomala UBC 951]
MSSATTSSYPAQGGCLCGAVRYELKAPPDGSWICWCLSCRKTTGSICSANSHCKAKDFCITKGEEYLTLYKEAGTSSGQVFEGYFCRLCGCNIHTTSDVMRQEGSIIVTSGTLDEPHILEWKPTAEFFCMRKPGYMGTFQGTKTFVKMPEGH